MRKRKQQIIRFRIDAEEKERFRAVAKQNGETISGLLLSWIQALITSKANKANQTEV